MKKKKDVPEVSGPLNWEELPEESGIPETFGRADLIFRDNGDKIEEQLKAEAAEIPADGVEPLKVRPDVLHYTALAVMSLYGVNQWTEKRALSRMEELSEAVSSAVKAACPGKAFDREDVVSAIMTAVAMKSGKGYLTESEWAKWQGRGLCLADSVASLLNTFRRQLPEAFHQDNPVIGWSIRNNGCTFIFRDGQKKVVEL